MSQFSPWRPPRRSLRNEAGPPDVDVAVGSPVVGVGAGIVVERVVAGRGEGGVGTGAGRPLPLHQSHARQVCNTKGIWKLCFFSNETRRNL